VIKEKIEKLQVELGRLLGSTIETRFSGRSRLRTVGRQRRGRRPMSAAAKAKIAAAARARWKKAKAAGKNSL
jgi:hypothetical protein